jgi:hypothetical protein
MGHRLVLLTHQKSRTRHVVGAGEGAPAREQGVRKGECYTPNITAYLSADGPLENLSHSNLPETVFF